jgi:cell division protein FtsQ
MSRDRVTMTRAEAIRIRHEEELKRREGLVKKTVAAPRLIPVKPKVSLLPRNKTTTGAAKPILTGRYSRRFDIAMSAPYGRPTPVAGAKKSAALAMPKIAFGPRWASSILMMLCVAGLYLMTSDNYFTVSYANVLGNNRVSAEEISSAMGAMGKPAALLSPAEIEYNILNAFPDIATAHIEINLPADVVVTVTERQPVAAWQQDGQTVWVDAQGYAFPPRGFVEGLVTVSAVGAPPGPDNVDAAQQVGAHPFLNEEMAAALLVISPRVPQGSTLVYDPRYGLGWTDPRGWQAYFGHTHGDVNTKIQIYQGMVDYLSKQGIAPKLISVEYPDAPFYRTEN